MSGTIAPEVSPAQIEKMLERLSTKIEPIQRQSGYVFGLFVVAMFMMGVVVGYSSLLAFLFWILLNLGSAILSVGIRTGPPILVWCFYLFLFCFLSCVFLALSKPLLVRRSKRGYSMVLHPKQEPVLFEFVTRLCNVVDAPIPSRIVVDVRSNASASFVHGPMSNEMQLMIGLPLILAFNTRQIAGVIAHEFGHFTQKSGLKLTYFVRSVEYWFTSAIEQEDSFDEKIRELVESSNASIRWLFRLVQLFVYFSELFIKLILLIAYLFVAKLLRQMEFDADRYEARVAGSTNFAKTSQHLQRLMIAEDNTFSDLDQFRRTQQLPDNLPALVVDNVANIDAAKFRQLEEEFLKVQTDWTDTHPCDRERIENTARENTEGIFTVELPARALFSDINGLCRSITVDLYKSWFGSEFKASNLRETEKLLKTRHARRKESEAALRFVMEQFAGYNTFFLPRQGLGKGIKQDDYKAYTEVRRSDLTSHILGYGKLLQQEQGLRSEIAKLVFAMRLMEAGYGINELTFGVANFQDAYYKHEQLQKQSQFFASQLHPLRSLFGERIIDALEFTRSPQVLKAIGERPETAHQIDLLLRIWNCIVDLSPTLISFQQEYDVAVLLITVAQRQADERVVRSLHVSLDRMLENMRTIQVATAHLTYPFEHGLGRISLSHFLLAKMPLNHSLSETLDAGSDMQSNIDDLMRACIARLGALAEKVENFFGFPPLPVPAELKEARKQQAKNNE